MDDKCDERPEVIVDEPQTLSFDRIPSKIKSTFSKYVDDIR